MSNYKRDREREWVNKWMNNEGMNERDTWSAQAQCVTRYICNILYIHIHASLQARQGIFKKRTRGRFTPLNWFDYARCNVKCIRRVFREGRSIADFISREHLYNTVTKIVCILDWREYCGISWRLFLEFSRFQYLFKNLMKYFGNSRDTLRMLSEYSCNY